VLELGAKNFFRKMEGFLTLLKKRKVFSKQYFLQQKIFKTIFFATKNFQNNIFCNKKFSK
jgi:hypothetical protein